MKLITTTSDTYLLSPAGLGAGTIYNIASPRVTQISGEEGNQGGIIQRGDAYRSIYAPNPYIQISIKAMDSANGIENSQLLRVLQSTTAITTFDTYAASAQLPLLDINNLTSQAVQSDTYQLNAQLFGAQGRFNYDLAQYATSQVTLNIINRTNVNILLRIRTEIYSR